MNKFKAMELTKEQIEKINSIAPNEWQDNEQGVFTQPYGIPVHIKEPVIYMRWCTGGVSGGSCWDSSNPRPYSREDCKPNFTVLDIVLKELIPTITYLQYKEIEQLIHTNHETQHEYYGNSIDFEIVYIILSELINMLQKFKQDE